MRKVLDRIQEVLEAAVESSDDSFDGEAGTEGRAAGAGDDQSAQTGKRCEAGNVLAHLRDIVGVEAIMLGGPPQPQRGDVVAHLQDGRPLFGSVRFFHA